MSDADVDNIVYFVLDACCQRELNECQDKCSSFLCEFDRVWTFVLWRVNFVPPDELSSAIKWMFHLGKSINCTEIIENMEYVKYKTSRICWWNKTIELEMIQRSYRCFHFIENIMFMFYILYCLKMPQFSLLLSSSQSWCSSREVCLNKRRKFLVRKTIFPAGQQLQSEAIVLFFVIVIVIHCCFHCYFYCLNKCQKFLVR